jgi:hypothetical protein
MVADSVIPESNVVLVPLESGVQLWRCRDDFVEVGDDVVAFCFGDADDFGYEAGAVEEGLPSRDCFKSIFALLELMVGGMLHTWVSPDEGVLVCDGFTTNSPSHIPRSLGLHLCRVDGCETFEVLLHWRAEHVVGSILR